MAKPRTAKTHTNQNKQTKPGAASVAAATATLLEAIKLFRQASQSSSHTVPLQPRGQVTVPKAIRDNFPSDEMMVRFDEISRGKFLVTVLATHELDDDWFFTPEWQRKEAQASDEASRGEGIVHENATVALEELRRQYS